MKRKTAYVKLLILVLIMFSCSLFEPQGTSHIWNIYNKSNDLVRIVLKGNNIEIDTVLTTSDVDFHASSFQFYFEHTDVYPVPAYTKDMFNELLDSVSIFKWSNNIWEEQNISEIWIYSNWDTITYTDEYYEHYYSFSITDSLLIL